MLALALGFAAALLAVGCTDNFTVGGAAPAAVNDAAQPENDADSGTGAAEVDSATAVDAGPDAPSCNELRAKLDQQLPLAKACTVLDRQACKQHVSDECNCLVPVSDSSSTAVVTYSAAVAEFVAAGCTATCSGCPTSSVATICNSDSASDGVCEIVSP